MMFDFRIPIGIENSIRVSYQWTLCAIHSHSKTQIKRMTVSRQMSSIKMFLSWFYFLTRMTRYPWTHRNAWYPKKKNRSTLSTRKSVMRPAMKGCLHTFFCYCWYSSNLSRFFDGHPDDKCYSHWTHRRQYRCRWPLVCIETPNK